MSIIYRNTLILSMTMFKQTMIALTSAVALGAAFAGSAEAVDFRFQFNNVANGGGVVEGFVRGLEDNGISAATSVEVTSNTAGFGIGEFVGNPNRNSWTVTEGILTNFLFTSFGILNTSPAVTDSSLVLLGSTTGQVGVVAVGLTDEPGGFSAESVITTGLTFTRVEEAESVPEPASLLGLFAIGAVAAGGALKKKAA